MIKKYIEIIARVLILHIASDTSVPEDYRILFNLAMGNFEKADELIKGEKE